MSSPRRRGSNLKKYWIPAFAGMTNKAALLNPERLLAGYLIVFAKFSIMKVRMKSEPSQNYPSYTRWMFFFSLTVFLLIFVYVFVRYNVLKAVDLQYIPMYIMNKVLALSSVVFISMSYLLGPLHAFDKALFEKKLMLRKSFGLIGFGAASIHSLLSLMLLTPYYYPGLYAAGRYTLFGQLHLLTGVLSIAIFAMVAFSSFPGTLSVTSRQWHAIQRMGYVALVFVLIHVYTLGVKSWSDITTWPGGLVPVSLIAFNIILFVMLVKIASLLFTHRVSGTDTGEKTALED